MTPEEERLVLDLHSIWGNRWSRIAQRLPGRTDNEIKNYWRTHMRKKAQERKQASSSSLSSSSCCSPTASDRQDDSSKTEQESMKDQGGCNELKGDISAVEGTRGWYSMDQIWKEIASSEEVKKGCSSTSAISTTGVASSLKYKIEEVISVEDKGGCNVVLAREEEITTEEGYSMDQIWEEIAEAHEKEGSTQCTRLRLYARSGESHETCQEKGCNFCSSPMVSPLWDYCTNSLWSMDEEEIRMLTPISDLVVSYYGHS